MRCLYHISTRRVLAALALALALALAPVAAEVPAPKQQAKCPEAGGGSYTKAGASKAEPTSRASSIPAPVERSVHHYLELVNRGSEAEATAFISENFAPAAFERVPLADRVEDMAILRQLLGSVRFVRTESSAASGPKLIVDSGLLGVPQELTLSFEPTPPYRLLDIGLPNNLPNSLPNSITPARDDGERIRRLNAFVSRLADAGFFSGSVMLAREGNIIFEQSYGKAERRFDVPNTLETRFYLCSITKTFTAVAIAQLVEQGKLSWEDPVSKFLPDFPTKEAAEKIRIKHLLTHTSGMTNTPYPPGPRSPTQAKSVAAMVEAAPRNAQLFEPGARYQYNNLGYLLLGRIIEITSGKDYYEYVRQHVFEPAGMAETGSDPYDVVERLSYAYEPVPSLDRPRLLDGRLYVPARALPFGGTYGTARDLLRFERALRSGALIDLATFSVMSSVRPEIGSPNWGYGFELVHQELPAGRGRKILGHGGNTVGVCTRWFRMEDAAAPYTFIVLSNSGQRACFPVVEYIFRLIPPSGRAS